MAAKNTLKYKRNKLPPLLEIVDDLLDMCLCAIRSPSFKGTISDLIRLIRLRRDLEPPKPTPTTAHWIDRSFQTSDDRSFQTSDDRSVLTSIDRSVPT
jgi:hypothetical protein